MTRITPRTCLYPLAGTLVITFALSISLTFRSDRYCYAATCGEWLFPLQARLHVTVWYCWIAIFVTFLAVRAFSPDLRRFLLRPLVDRELPIIRTHITVSGLLAVVWVVVLYGVIIAIWWIQLRDYFVERGRAGGVAEGNQTIAAIALVGHLCDVTMGMVLIPISRHSALASFFSLSVSTTLTFHMVAAYTLFILVLIHGFLYVSWIPMFSALSETLRMVFPVLNPTYLYTETWPGNTNSLGIWRASLIFTGIFATAIMGLISITTLPMIRQKHFNLFYYTHLLVIPAIIIVCLHASTVFYCAAPGLFMWVLDWGMRIYELRQKLDGKIISLSNGWYCLALQLPRRRLDGCACTSPLAHFYLYHSESSVRQLHPFTTISHLASQNIITPVTEDDFPIQFLFRKQGRNKPAPKPSAAIPNHRFLFLKVFTRQTRTTSTEWTDRLASLADKAILLKPPASTSTSLTKTVDQKPLSPQSAKAATTSTRPPLATRLSSFFRRDVPLPLRAAQISVRAEGPYFTPADPSRYHTVVCLVAGTGVSGAIAIVGAFKALQCQRSGDLAAGAECESDSCGAPNSATVSPCPASAFSASPCSAAMSLGGGGDGAAVIKTKKPWRRCVVVWSVRAEDYIELPFLKEGNSAEGLEVRVHLTGQGRSRLDMSGVLANVCGPAEEGFGSTWVYLSGPTPFIDAGERACKGTPGVEWLGARWDI